MGMTKVLVTGGTGFIGSHLVKALLQRGSKVIVASDLTQFGPENLTDLGVNSSDIEIRRADLTQYDQALKAAEGAEVVFHLAARVGSLKYLHESELAELAALQSNLLIDTNIFRACLERGIGKLIYASSCAVYPMYKQFSSDAVFSESDLDVKTADFLNVSKPLNAQHETLIAPDGGYGWAKLMGEIQLSWMRTINVGIARIFNIYGENEPLGEKAHVVADLVRKAIQYPEVEFVVWGDGTQTRDLLYVSDCVDGLLALEVALSNPKVNFTGPLTVNIGSGVPVPVGVLAQKVIQVSAKDVEMKYDLSKPVGPRGRTANIEKAKEFLGWVPQVSLEEGLSKIYRWVEVKLSGSSSNGLQSR